MLKLWILKYPKFIIGTYMQPRQLREKIKALKQEINMLNSQTDILKDKLESRDLELEYLKSRTEKLKIYLKESSERKNIITKQKNEYHMLKDKYYKLWLNDTEKYSKEIKKIFLIFGIAYPGLILMGYLLGKII
jgi:chromosome segregation ATPase